MRGQDKVNEMVKNKEKLVKKERKKQTEDEAFIVDKQQNQK